MARYITAAQAVERVLRTMSLSVSVDIAGSLDSTTALLWHLLAEEGQKLLDENTEWQMLNRSYIFNTVPGQTDYPLPADFQHFLDDTGWNNTARIPLIGPLSSQTWRMLKARQLGGTTFQLQYIIENDTIKLYHSPSEAQELVIDYKGRGWVQDSVDSTVYLDRPVRDADIVLYSPRLITAALHNRWRVEKGFDTIASQKEYDDALAIAKYNDRPKMVLSLNSKTRFPYIGYTNMPDTGYGS